MLDVWSWLDSFFQIPQSILTWWVVWFKFCLANSSTSLVWVQKLTKMSEIASWWLGVKMMTNQCVAWFKLMNCNVKSCVILIHPQIAMQTWWFFEKSFDMIFSVFSMQFSSIASTASGVMPALCSVEFCIWWYNFFWRNHPIPTTASKVMSKKPFSAIFSPSPLPPPCSAHFFHQISPWIQILHCFSPNIHPNRPSQSPLNPSQISIKIQETPSPNQTHTFCWLGKWNFFIFPFFVVISIPFHSPSSITSISSITSNLITLTLTPTV